MKIIVDADACPVKDIIEDLAKRRKARVIMVSNYSHEISSQYAEVVRVDKVSQAADVTIVNMTETGDIVVTQDYGLASLVLGKGAVAINPNGRIYTANNIDMLLTQRYLNAKARQAGLKSINPRKRTGKDDNNFQKNFDRILQNEE